MRRGLSKLNPNDSQFRPPPMRIVFALCLLLPAAGVPAQVPHYYKSVHGDGTVTYSDTRSGLEGPVETISVPHDDGAVLEQGQQRLDEIRAAGEDLEKQRGEGTTARSDYEKKVAQAREEVAEAERDLQGVLQSKRSATPYRIGIAEERLELARKKLREIEHGGP